ncbi:MAG: hypothetical protein WD231_04365 [Candidatus Woykebacteria bacterium]
MPGPTKLDSVLLYSVAFLILVSSLFSAYFTYQTYSQKSTKEEAGNLLVLQNKNIEETDPFLYRSEYYLTSEVSPKIELLQPAQDNINTFKTGIRARISDPNATVSFRFNDQDLDSIFPDKESGEFIIENLKFKEGDNFLTIEAKSDVGKVLPLVKTITYQPSLYQTSLIQNQNSYPLLTVSMISNLVFLVLIGYLVYRRRKYFSIS